jgi:hypothetical protein
VAADRRAVAEGVETVLACVELGCEPRGRPAPWQACRRATSVRIAGSARGELSQRLAEASRTPSCGVSFERLGVQASPSSWVRSKGDDAYGTAIAARPWRRSTRPKVATPVPASGRRGRRIPLHCRPDGISRWRPLVTRRPGWVHPRECASPAATGPDRLEPRQAPLAAHGAFLEIWRSDAARGRRSG